MPQPLQIQLINIQSPRRKAKASQRQIDNSNNKSLLSNHQQNQQNQQKKKNHIDSSLQTQPQYYKHKKSKKYNKKDQSNLQSNVAYPEATIREYLNQKRTTQNKVCHVLFCIFMIVVIMLLGVGFFYGNYGLIGQTIIFNSDDKVVKCLYVNQDATSCVDNCVNGKLYLGKMCITQTTPFTNQFSTNLDKQITMYTLKESFTPMIYGTFSTLVFTSLCFIILICFSKAIYLYIGATFVMLLGFAFFLLKNVQTKLSQYQSSNYTGPQGPGSIFYTNIQKILPLCFILMALYLIIFPFVIFSPYKISTATKIITKMRKYFIRMSSVNFFTYLIVFLAWGLLMLEIFLIMNIFTAGTESAEKNSFFYVFTSVKLSHPAVLVLHFFGVYWFFATLVSWHKYFTSSAMCLWYFEEGEKLFPVTRGLKRSWHSLGTAALDALLIPFQWLTLIMYTICKFSNQQQQKNQNSKQSDRIQLFGCSNSIRGCFNSLYCKINPYSFASAPLTNYPLKQSCEISAVTFAYHNHKFFNLGGTLTILLSLYNCLVFLIINYIILYTQVYSISSPPPITSLGLPMLIIFLISITLGAMQANMYTAALDCLIFCFLLQKKSNIQNTKNEVKDILQAIWHDDENQGDELIEMFEYEDD